MKIKFVILALSVGLTVMTSKGQSIKDFFIPDTAYNKASFYSPDKTGNRTGMTRVIYYTKNGANYDILDANLFDGKGDASSIITKTVQFSATEAKMIRSSANKKQDYNPPKIILKMPAAGQTISWTYSDISGDLIKCTASFTTVTIDGVQKKAIKKIEVVIGYEDQGKTITYYVKGIGLWKTDLQGSDGVTQTFDKFDGLIYDPTAKQK